MRYSLCGHYPQSREWLDLCFITEGSSKFITFSFDHLISPINQLARNKVKLTFAENHNHQLWGAVVRHSVEIVRAKRTKTTEAVWLAPRHGIIYLGDFYDWIERVAGSSIDGGTTTPAAAAAVEERAPKMPLIDGSWHQIKVSELAPLHIDSKY